MIFSILLAILAAVGIVMLIAKKAEFIARCILTDVLFCVIGYIGYYLIIN